ncbi:MAG: hypothetical protein IJ752_04830 [Alphaproteobacteria bacterium]|nr:hypothetical protein [Alphaproteobacteria bacterium]
MALFSDKKNFSADDRSGLNQTAPFSFPQIIALICIFGFCLSYLLSAAIIAGRFIEYRIPLFLMELPMGMVYGMVCLLFSAVLAGLSLQKSLNADGSSKSILSRSQKISYFFSLLTTLCFTAYGCAVLVHFLKTGVFLSECLYLVFLYACVLGVHLKARKSSLAHMFTSAAFVLILIITAFYSGIAYAKIENRKMGFINGEPFLLVSAQNQNYILVGLDSKTNKSNGKIMVLPRQNTVLEQTFFWPAGLKRYKDE